jgi:hypothetical protein
LFGPVVPKSALYFVFKAVCNFIIFDFLSCGVDAAGVAGVAGVAVPVAAAGVACSFNILALLCRDNISFLSDSVKLKIPILLFCFFY